MDGVIPAEWVVRGFKGAYPAGVVRLLHLGSKYEIYFRAVTDSPQPEDRELVGYWSTLDEAVTGILVHDYDRLTTQQRANGPSTVRPRPGPVAPWKAAP